MNERFKTRDEFLKYLHGTLDERARPEDVGQAILAGEKFLPLALPKALRKRLSSMKPLPSYMSADFKRVVGAESAVKVAKDIFPKNGIPVKGLSPDDPASIRAFISRASKAIGRKVRENFAQRKNRKDRRKSKIKLSKRQFNKLYRFICRLEEKAERMEREGIRRDMTMAAKSKLASKISWRDFKKSAASAAFIAYYTATSNRRSEFTWGKQSRAYDKVAESLLEEVCAKDKSSNWFAISHVFTPQRVVSRLTDKQKGRLAGLYFGVVEQACLIMEEVWRDNDIARDTMIVKRGNDSSTWNTMAGAYNKAREAWFAILRDMGMDAVIEACCPGKALRLMAADVAWMHRHFNEGLDPDTSVWNELPLPWDVVLHEVPCPRKMVQAVCDKHKVKSSGGWVAARDIKVAQAFKATPELVHGVTVSSPSLGKILKKSGAFSGKGLRRDAKMPGIIKKHKNRRVVVDKE